MRADLNLLPLFQAVYEEQGVAKAAKRLHVTPSAVSHALNRLRSQIGDPMFVRQGSRMVPTARGKEIARRLDTLLPQLIDVFAPPIFEESTSHQVFVVAASPSVMLTLMPKVGAHFRNNAPNVHLKLRRLQTSAVDELSSGTIDIAIGHFNGVPTELVAKELYIEPYVLAVSNRAIGPDFELTLPVLSELPYIDLQTETSPFDEETRLGVRRGVELVIQNPSELIDRAMADAGLVRRVMFKAPDAITGMALAGEAGAVCLVPQSAGRRFGSQLGCALFPVPLPNVDLTLQTLVHREFGQRLSTRWLLELLTTLAKSDPNAP